MRFHGFRFQVALLVFLVVFGIGLGMQYLHQKTQIIDPLIDQVQEIPGVLYVSAEKGLLNGGSRTLVTLQVDQDAPLAIVFPRVYQTLLSSAGNYTIEVQDSPNATILELFKRIQIAVEEAIMTGEFTALEARVHELAQAAGVTWELGLDREFIYLSLAEDEHTLRRIISRTVDEGKVIVSTDGGVSSWTSG